MLSPTTNIIQEIYPCFRKHTVYTLCIVVCVVPSLRDYSHTGFFFHYISFVNFFFFYFSPHVWHTTPHAPARQWRLLLPYTCVFLTAYTPGYYTRRVHLTFLYDTFPQPPSPSHIFEQQILPIIIFVNVIFIEFHCVHRTQTIHKCPSFLHGQVKTIMHRILFNTLYSENLFRIRFRKLVDG